MKITKSCLAVVIILLCVTPVLAAPPAKDIPYTIQQITERSNANEWNPILDAGQILWYGWDPNSCDPNYFFKCGDDMTLCDTEIFLYDGAAKQQLTQNYYSELQHSFHNGRAAWVARQWPPDCHFVDEIIFYNGTTVQQISQNGPDKLIGSPQTHNGQVIWSQIVGTGPSGDIRELFFFDGVATRQVTSDGSSYRGAILNNGRIALTLFDGNDNEVFIWENGSLTQITNNSTTDTAVAFDGNYILMWGIVAGSTSVPAELFLWDGTSTRRITNNNIVDYNPSMSNGQIVWEGPDPKGGLDKEVFLWNGSTTRQLTNNRFDDDSAFIHNGQVAWQTYDGNDWEVYVWNGANTYQLTKNTVTDFVDGINNGQVTWEHYMDPEYYDYEIFLATPK